MEKKEEEKKEVNLKGGEKKVKVEKKAQPAKKTAPKGKAKTTSKPKPAEAKVKKEAKPTPEVEEKVEPSPQDFEELLKLYENSLAEIKEGEIIKGKVLKVGKEDVIIDVSFKSEGIIPLSEFGNHPEVKVGDEIDIFLESIEDQDGQVVLSKSRADFLLVWDRIRKAYETGEPMDGKVRKRVKGGMIVNLFGVEAFLPGSQIDTKQVRDFDQYVGQTLLLKVIKLNKLRRNIVVSRRAILEEERVKLREKLLSEIEEGQVRKGEVKNITDFGAFVDLGGLDGLLHITDMSWGRISHPSELLALGDEIEVKVLTYDRQKDRVSLGLKQLTPYPWENVEEKYPVDKKVRGRVVSIADYGAFVELEKGVEGLIHVSDMSWTEHIRHPSKVVAIGDIVEAVVLSVDGKNEKIALGLKQVEPDPWLTLPQRHPVGSKLVGRVRNLTSFGAFVEVEEGIDGLVHISDMSWTKRVQHPSEVMKKGEKVEVVVLDIDQENRRVSLGYKQAQDNPWPELAGKYAKNVETKGLITRIYDRGVVVNLPGDVEGFVPLAHLGKPGLKKPSEAFKLKDELPLRVVEFDAKERKIILSVREYFEGKEKELLDNYLAQHPSKTVKMRDMVENPPEKEE